jgi:excisionase family DNA binding protein
MSLLDDYLTDEQLATELGVSKRTIERWRRKNETPPITRLGNRILTRRSAVVEWLASCEQAA